MPKSIAPINKFEKGIVNKVDRRDIPEGGVTNIVDLVPDIIGQLRQMGGEVLHATLSNETIIGTVSKGYGLFAFNTDFSPITNQESPSRCLAIQQKNNVGIYSSSDSQLASDEITLNNSSSSTAIIKPIFVNVDGQLRIVDAEFSNQASDQNPDGSDYIQLYTYIRKWWFANNAQATSLSYPATYDGSPRIENDSEATLGDWTSLQSYIFPPTTYKASTDRGNFQLYSHSSNSLLRSQQSTIVSALANGQIALVVQQGAAADVDTGEWMADSYGFGVSFQYDNGQESQVTAFPDLLDASSMTDNVPMAFKLMVDMATVTDFDIRLNGINLYWTEDGNGTFDDPLWLGYWHWGTNTTDTSYFLTHEGDKQTNLVNSGDTYYIDGITHGGESTAGTVIKTLPAVTFELRNGWDNSSKSISSKYKTAVITNRRLYAGGIQSYRFDTTPDTTNVNGNCSRQAPIAVDPKKLDRMLKSPVNQFDVLPDENFIDVSVNDGESIVYLASFNDRILQFKEKNLHIINISGDYEYLEGQYKFLGIKSQTQVMTIETGVVWINELGCYFYNGEGPPLNLIDAGLRLTSESGYDNKFTGWNQFITDGSLIGYIKSQKQIVIFGESGGETAGDILIFDFPTQSWSFGKDKVSETLKSNIIQDYDNTCMYLANAISTLSSYDTFQVEKKVPGQNAVWLITQVNGYASIADSSLKIGSTTDITHNLSFASSVDASGNIQTNHNGPDQTVVSFGDYLRTMVESGPLGDRLQAGISGNTLVIAYSPDEIAIDDSLSGENLSFTSSPTGSYAVNKAADSPNDNMHLPLVHQAWTRQTAGSATGGPSLAYGSRSHLPDGTNNALILRFHPWDQHPSGGMPNLEIWNWNSYTSSYHMPTLLQHATLSGIAVHPDQGAINVHNPFAYTFNGNDGHPNSDGQNSATITSNRKCLNIDTTNYSRIEITKDSGNYSWGTNKLVLIFGRWADLQAAEGFITQYDGSDGYGLINYSLDEDGYYSSNAHFKDNWSSDVSVGNGTLLNDTSVFSTWGYNSGFHQGLGFGNTSNSNAHMSLPIQQDYAANSLKVPVVVFRKLNNPSELQISLLGDQTAYFSIGSKYSIVGGGESGKAEHAKTNQSNHLTNMLLHGVQSYRSGDHWTIGGQVNSGGYSGGLEGTTDQHSFTVLTFLRNFQVNSGGANDPLYPGKWDGIKSYGDMCIDANMVFSLTAADVNIDNSFNTGLASKGVKYVASPNRLGNMASEDSYSIQVRDHNNVTRSSTHTSAVNESPISINQNILANLNNAETIADGYSLEADPYELVQSGSLKVSIGNSSTTSSRLRIYISNTKIIGSPTSYINDLSSVEDLGLRPGMCFQFTALGTESNNDTFLVENIYPRGKQADGSSIPDTGLSAGNGAYTVEIDIATSAAQGADGTVIKQSFAQLDGSAFPNNLVSYFQPTQMRVSGIVIEGKNTDTSNPVSVSTNTHGNLSVLEFTNQELSSITSEHLYLETKDIDFGSPGQRKKIYYVDVSYKYSAVGNQSTHVIQDIVSSSVDVFASINNQDEILSDIAFSGMVTASNTDIGSYGLPAHDSWHKVRLYFNNIQAPILCNSIRFIIKANEAISDFKLNDMSVTFRQLNS